MRRLNRFNLIQIATLLLSLGFAALAIGPMRLEAERRAEILKVRILQQLETQLGAEIRYSSISPALLSALTVKNLGIEFEQGTIHAEKLRIFYNPFRQFSGNSEDPVRFINRVVISGVHVDFDFTGTDEPASAESASGFDYDFWPLLTNKTVLIRDVTARIKSDAVYLLEASFEDFELRHDGEKVRYRFNGEGSVNDPGIYNSLGTPYMVIGSKGIFAPSESSLNGRLDIVTAESDLVVISPMSLDFSYGLDGVTVRRVDDNQPLDLSLSYNDGAWNVSGETVSLALADIAAPGKKRYGWNRWFASTIDGKFLFEGSSETGSLKYVLDLALGLPVAENQNMEALIVASGNRGNAMIENFQLQSDWGRIAYFGRFGIEELAPVGTLNLELDEEILGYPVLARLDMDYSQGAVTAEPVDFDAAGMSFHDFRFLLIREGNSIALSLLAVPEQKGDDRQRKLLVDALIDFEEKPVVHGFASIDGIDTANIVRLAGLAGASGMPVVNNSYLHANGFFEANSDSWVMNIDNASLVDKSNPENTISVNGRALPGLWALDGLHVSWNDFVVDGRIVARTEGDYGTADGRFIIGDEVLPLEGEWGPDGAVIRGNHGLEAIVGRKSANGRSLLVKADSLSIPLKSGRATARLDLRGRLVPDDWDIYINEADLRIEDRPNIPDLNLAINGTVNPGRILLPYISYNDGVGELKGNASFESYGRDLLQGRIFLGGEDGESYTIQAGNNQDEWDLSLNIVSARMERILQTRLSGKAHISGSAHGALSNPYLSLNFETEDGILDGQPFLATGRAAMEDGRLRAQDLVFDHEGVSLNRGLVLADFNTGSVRSTAELQATFNQVPVSSGFSLGVDFSSGISFSNLKELGSGSFSGTLATRAILWDTREHLPPFTFQFVKTSESFNVSTPDGETLAVNYNFSSGKLDVLSGDPMPVVAVGGGTVGNGKIDLSFPELSIDPVLINYVMVRDPILLQYHVIFQDGRFVGNLDIKGSSSDPDMNGIIRAENLKVDTPYTYADIEPASTDIHFEGNRITVDQIDIPVGDGFVYARGYLVLDRWSLTDFNMYYGGRGGPKSDGVPIYYPLLGIFLDGRFAGEIHMTGNGQRFYLDGDLHLPYLKASLGSPVVPVPQRKAGKFPKPIFLDFNFVTGNNCTFYLPNEQLKILRATAEPNQTLNFTFSTDPRSLTLTGNLPIKTGNISYFDRDFQVTYGNLQFNETMGNFDPMLDFRAETRVRDSENEDVTVALVYNAPIKSDFNPGVETVPSRSELEILELFGQAVVPYGDSTEADANTVILATGGMFAQAGIVQPFEEVLRESLNLDMVTIRTDIIENTLSEGLARNDETETSYVSSGLGRYLDNTSLYAGKYIGNALFVSGSVSASYFDEQRNRSVFGGLEFETSVSFEMETPFFNVAWSYSPDPSVDQNFVADNEISLKWQFSF